MIQWSFTCAAGHSHGPFRSQDEAIRIREEMNAEPRHGECLPITADPESFDLAVPVAMFVAKPEIEPHYNRSLGMHIESRKHLEAMQEKFGVEDVVVKGDGERFVPRDFERQHTEAVAALEKNDALARHATPTEEGLELEAETYVGEEA